jgi:hypothetical protein
MVVGSPRPGVDENGFLKRLYRLVPGGSRLEAGDGAGLLAHGATRHCLLPGAQIAFLPAFLRDSAVPR